MTWTEVDKVGLRDYLSSGSGKNFMEMLKSSVPRISGKTQEEVYGEAKLKQGWEDCLDTIIANSKEVPQSTEETFVDTSKGLSR